MISMRLSLSIHAALYCACFFGIIYSAEITDTLDNGCSITRESGNSSTDIQSLMLHHFSPLPHLNCSGLGHTNLNVEGVVADTKTITVSYNDLVEFDVDNLEIFVTLVKLELQMNNLVRVLPSKINLEISTMEYISVSNNKLEIVPTLAFKAFPNLKYLLMHSNNIQRIEPTDFRFNPKLWYLQFGPNPITNFNEEWMGNVNLTGLGLQGCGLRQVPTNLQRMTGLMLLDLSNNLINTISSNSFNKLTSLVYLLLSTNRIEFIDKAAFKGATKLAIMDLSDNSIQTLTEGTFDDVKTENFQLNLYENPLQCDCTMTWFKRWADKVKQMDTSADVNFKCMQPARNNGKKMYQLTVDDFSCRTDDVIWQDCNSIPTVQPTIMPPAATTVPPATNPPPVNPTSTLSPTARNICPDECSCYDENGMVYSSRSSGKPDKEDGWMHWMKKSFPAVNCNVAGLKGLPQDIRIDVKTLTLSGNKFTTFDVAQFAKFTSLEKLDLKKNTIKAIKPASVTMGKLTFLNLGSNNISVLSSSQFKSFPNLEVLAIRHNAITKLPRNVFQNNRKLVRFYLGPNPIKNFNGDWLHSVKLRSLSLKNVSLTKVPDQLRTQTNLTYVDFSDNSISIIHNGTFSKCRYLKWAVFENNKIKTVEADAFNGATSLRMIDLSENKLSTLPATVFSNISQERLTVELWENQFVCDCKMKAIKAWIDKLDAADPMTEIRFKCSLPVRMRDQLSDNLAPDDFVCQKNDNAVPSTICQKCAPPGGQIALAVVLTFIVTALIGVLAWRCTFKRRYSDLLLYAKQRNEGNMDDFDEM